MQLSGLPLRITEAIATAAGSAYRRVVPTASQIGITDGAASFADGFPPLTAQPIASGGVPPDIRDMNGFLYAISAWAMWQSAGGAVLFDATFSTAVGGYPKGARVMSSANPGLTWVSTADGNTTNPDAGGAANWVAEGDIGHSYNPGNGFVTIGPIILNFGAVSTTDSTGRVDVTFAKPFTTAVLARGASNDSGPGTPSAWAGTGNATLTGMRIGTSVANGPGQAGIPALSGTASTWFALGV